MPEDGGDETRLRKTPTVETVREWLAAAISRRTGIPPAEVNANQPFDTTASTRRVVEMAGDFSAWLGRPLPPTFFWDYPTVERVARHIGRRDCARVSRWSARAVAPEPIAIVGMACRFPGAENVEDWQLLRDGVDAITEVPPGTMGTRPARLREPRRLSQTGGRLCRALLRHLAARGGADRPAATAPA